MTPATQRIDVISVRDKSLLLVEDDDVLRERLAAALAARGFLVCPAASVATGLEMVKDSAPAFAVVDLRVDDGNGLSIVSQLSSARPDSRVIVMTGYGNIPTAVSAAKLGACDYMTKPVDADEITDALLTPSGSMPPPPRNPMAADEKRWSHISSVLAHSSNNLSLAARLLGLHRRTLQRIVRRHE